MTELPWFKLARRGIALLCACIVRLEDEQGKLGLFEVADNFLEWLDV